MKKLLFISLMLACSITGFSQKGKWKNAQKINSIESYQEFLKEYPKSEFSNDARLKLIELEFKNAKTQNTIATYENFIKNYPNNSYEPIAKQYIQEIYYKNAINGNTNDLYNDFLARYPNSEYEDDIKIRMVKLLYIDYTSANISLGSHNYKNVKVKNLILIRFSSNKNKADQGIPIMDSKGSLLIENGKVKIDKTKKPYSITYYAINGQDIREIKENKISILNSKNIYKFEVIDDNPKIEDSFLLSNVLSRLKNNSLPRETALAIGFCWFGQLSNKDYAFEARSNFKNTMGIPNVGLLNISVYEDKNITGIIVGQVLLENGKYIISPGIECLTNNNEIVKILLNEK